MLRFSEIEKDCGCMMENFYLTQRIEMDKEDEL